MRFVVRCISASYFLIVTYSVELLFLPRIYQIRITTRRMPEEMARCRERSCSIETRHRKNHGTVLRLKLSISLDISKKLIKALESLSMPTVIVSFK